MRGLTLWLLGAVARMAAEVVVLAGRVPLAIFQYFGEQVLKIPVLDSTAASGVVTITAADTDGHTLDAGAQIDIDGVAFITTADAVIAALSTTATAPVVAIQAGSAGTGLTGGDVQLVSPTEVWVDSVSLNAPTTGGVDGESDDEYVDRLSDELGTLSPKAILLADFEAIARRDAEVYRALAIDNLVPPSTTGVEGAVTVAVMGATGAAVSSAAKTRVEDALEAGRVLAIDVHVIDPTVTPIDVDWAGTAYDGFDPASVQAAGNQAVTDFLDAAAWGRPPNGDPEQWVDEPIVLRNDLFGVLYAVPGLRHVTSLELAETGDPLGVADVTLAGPAGVPAVGDVNGSVS